MESLKRGADIIVNTDADNQYKGEDIYKLITPILEGRSQIVIGERPIIDNPDFSLTKKILQKLGSWVVRILSGTNVPDAPSGFRAYSREAALRLNVFSKYTYTLETLIQAGRNGIPIESVKIRTNPKTRESRLFKSVFQYIYRSVATLFRLFAVYSPFCFFCMIGVSFLLGAFLYCWIFNTPPVIFVFSTILAEVLIVSIAFLAVTISHNRRLEEDILYHIKKNEIENQ